MEEHLEVLAKAEPKNFPGNYSKYNVNREYHLKKAKEYYEANKGYKAVSYILNRIKAGFVCKDSTIAKNKDNLTILLDTIKDEVVLQRLKHQLATCSSVQASSEDVV